MKNSKFRGSTGDLKQGKSGNARVPNRYQALASPGLEDYEECFPSLPVANLTAPTKDSRTAVKIGESPRSVTTSSGVYNFAEEGPRLEKLTMAALNRAKKGRSHLSQKEINYFQTWLANYRAANAQNLSQNSQPVVSKCTSCPVLGGEGIAAVSEVAAQMIQAVKVELSSEGVLKVFDISLPSEKMISEAAESGAETGGKDFDVEGEGIEGGEDVEVENIGQSAPAAGVAIAVAVGEVEAGDTNGEAEPEDSEIDDSGCSAEEEDDEGISDPEQESAKDIVAIQTQIRSIESPAAPSASISGGE
ncbi:hypothetical protein U1Q18_023467, partial [Sarracenia purpurea var. burkii]